MASVRHLFRARQHRLPMEEVTEIRALQDTGFEGCVHARPGGKRQVLLADTETLEAMGLTPGIVRENITTEGLDVNGLEAGTRLRIGEALLEVTIPCTPCDLMDRIRPGLLQEIRGRRGVLCRVRESGTIRRGDAIERLS